MHCSLRLPDAVSVFIRFNYDAMRSLKSLNLSAAVLQRLCCCYIILRCDLDFWPRDLYLWPLTLNICSVSSVKCWNSVPNLNAIELTAAELLRLQYLTLWPWTCATCCSRLWDNFNQVWPSTTYPCLNYSVLYVDTLCHAVTLTFDAVTLKVCSTSSAM